MFCSVSPISCKQAYYQEASSTNNVKLARGFTKESRVTVLSRNRSDNCNGEFYHPDKPSTTTKLKSLGSGPPRFSTVQEVSSGSNLRFKVNGLIYLEVNIALDNGKKGQEVERKQVVGLRADLESEEAGAGVFVPS